MRIRPAGMILVPLAGDSVPGLSTPIFSVPWLPGIAAAGHCLLRPDAATADSRSALRGRCRPRTGFSEPASDRDVRHRQDAGGLLCGERQHAVRCG